MTKLERTVTTRKKTNVEAGKPIAGKNNERARKKHWDQEQQWRGGMSTDCEEEEGWGSKETKTIRKKEGVETGKPIAKKTKKKKKKKKKKNKDVQI